MYQLKINSISLLSLNTILSILPEYFIATSILSIAIFFSISQKLKVQTKQKIKINFFLLNMTQLYYLSILIIFFYCFLCFKQNFLYNFSCFSNTIHIDYISIFAKLIIGISCIVYLIFIQQYLMDQNLNNFEYYIIILTAILGLCLLCCSDDLLTAYLAIELQGLSFYILASFKKTSNYSIESGVKYFILGSFSTVIFLLGINLIYIGSGTMSILDLKDLFSWTFFSNNFLVDQNSILNSIMSFQAVSLILYELCSSKSDFVNNTKFEMIYDLFSIVPEKACIFIKKESDIITIYYDLLNLMLIEEVEYIENFMISTLLEYLKEFSFLNLYIPVRDKQILDLFDIPVREKQLLDLLNIPVKEITEEQLFDLCQIIELEKQIMNLFFEKKELNILEGNFFLDNYLIKLGLFLLLTSLFLKLALSPFHLWSPDIYEGSPSSTTFFFTVISKLSIFVFLLKICYVSFYSLIIDWQYYLLFVALISVFIGSIGGLKQRKFKSLLAYSSISNMGLILISFSAGNFEGIKSIFYYFIIYILSGLAMWSILLILRLKRKNSIEKHNKDLGDFSVLKESNVVLSYASVITLFTIAGIPPTVGFIAKVYIFVSLNTSSLYLVAIISIISTVISTFYYIRIIKTIFFENLLVGKLFYPINSKSIIICNVLFLLLLFLFINPEFINFYSYKVTLYLSKTFY